VIFADELAARHELQKVAQQSALIEFARR
jgi:hypothetical protein